jgi:DNA-binding XRE family transcriptional regulator
MNTLTLKAARVNAGISVKAAAEAVGVTEDTMYRYESGKSSPKIGTAVKLAGLYGVSIELIDFSVQEGSE